ncbi:2-hydroxyacyl-CoA dehydratase subunit D [Myxococcota bacterium]
MTNARDEEMSEYVGFTCAYAPTPLIHAAGFVPHRILPVGDAPDQAGVLLHDNMCPHVKRVLDRALAGDLPTLAGVIIMESCDAMRRLADAWQQARPDDPLVTVDLPFARNDRSAAYFADHLRQLARTLEQWSGRRLGDELLRESCRNYDALVDGLAKARTRAATGTLDGGWTRLQKLTNQSVTQPIEDTRAALAKWLDQEPVPPTSGVPVSLFGNVLADEEAFTLLGDCGARVVNADLCTADRQLTPLLLGEGEVYAELSNAILSRPVCARTFAPDDPNRLARQVIDDARRAGARGVIAHVMKFCDPYLARLPTVRDQLRQAGLPMLVLEDDCTLRSLGQHKTRIQAFVEMLTEEAP